jgi:predicted transcriptional regulator
MRLEQYLDQRNETQVDFARRAGIPQSSVSRICTGKDVRGRLWARIIAATGSRVQPRDHFPPKVKPKRRRVAANGDAA